MALQRFYFKGIHHYYAPQTFWTNWGSFSRLYLEKKKVGMIKKKKKKKMSVFYNTFKNEICFCVYFFFFLDIHWFLKT